MLDGYKKCGTYRDLFSSNKIWKWSYKTGVSIGGLYWLRIKNTFSIYLQFGNNSSNPVG